MVASIPASAIVNVIPGVLGTGGNPLSLNAVFVDNSGDKSIPIGTVQPFASLADVQAWYGASSNQAALAAVYFNGFTNCTQLPGLLYFSQYNTANVAAYLRGGTVSGMTLTQLQALSGTMTFTVNGSPITTSSINLAAASSFSNAATLISAGISGGTICSYDAQRQAFVLTSPTTGAASTITVANVGTLATGLKLTTATGALTSQGADAATPAAAMLAITLTTQNWATFTTVSEPDLPTKLLFAAWVNTSNQRYTYACYDSDITAQTANTAGCFGALTSTYIGVEAIWDPTGKIAAFFCGTTGSIDFNANAGRITYAGKGQSGLVPAITSQTIANNLIGNGYNFYANYATANQQFIQYQPGQISGIWKWADPYVNQIWLNAQFQLELMNLLALTKSIPYNQRGYGMIRAALLGPIQAALLFGAIQPGVVLSSSQAVAVNTAAGANVSNTLQNIGWYLQILPASAQTRGLRGSPPMTFWYTDGGSIQKITLASIDVM